MSAATFFRSAPVLLCALASAALLAHAPVHAQASDAPATPGDRLRARLLERALQNPAPLPAGVQKLPDLPYGSDARQRMDVYLPPADARPAGLRAPVIFMVHGGAWRTGDKAMPKVVENKVARWVARGFVFVSINYRMLPDTPVAQQAYDVAQALAAAQQRAPGWGA
ncbi:MAG: alpha/beta hydrolase, partial [Acidovorax sp.]